MVILELRVTLKVYPITLRMQNDYGVNGWREGTGIEICTG